MIPNVGNEGWHYHAVKRLSTLLGGISSKDKSDFYCFSCLHFFRTGNKFKFHEKICKIKDFFGIAMPSENDGCENNPEKSSTTITSEHIPCGCSMSTS